MKVGKVSVTTVETLAFFPHYNGRSEKMMMRIIDSFRLTGAAVGRSAV